MNYYYANTQNQPLGPYSLEDLRQLHLAGVIKPETYVIEENGTAWQTMSTLLRAQQPAGIPPAFPPPPGYVLVPVDQRKSKVAAGVLGILLGFLGAHNFYLGYTGKAVGQLLITVLSCFLLSWAVWIWGLVEGILILTGSMAVDERGIPLKD